MTLDDGDYELVLGQDQGFSEEPINVAEDLTEAPNQSSEVSNTLAPNPTQDVCPAQLVCVRSYSRLWWPCSTTRNERQTVASERSLFVPSV
jgi:hypothetical protein